VNIRYAYLTANLIKANRNDWGPKRDSARSCANKALQKRKTGTKKNGKSNNFKGQAGGEDCYRAETRMIVWAEIIKGKTQLNQGVVLDRTPRQKLQAGLLKKKGGATTGRWKPMVKGKSTLKRTTELSVSSENSAPATSSPGLSSYQVAERPKGGALSVNNCIMRGEFKREVARLRKQASVSESKTPGLRSGGGERKTGSYEICNNTGGR